MDVIGADPAFDLAVLKVRGAKLDLPALPLGRSDDLLPGETVVAIGNPFGLANTVTTGVISALHRSIDTQERNYEDFIQTDAAINPGNSGGALLNIQGALVGINTAVYKSGTGIGFAIPAHKAKAVVREVLQYGEVRPVYTGVVVGGREQGAKVLFVRRGSPGERGRPEKRRCDHRCGRAGGSGSKQLPTDRARNGSGAGYDHHPGPNGSAPESCPDRG